MGMNLHMTMLEDLKRAAWARTSPVEGQMNAWEFRKDALGNLVRYNDFNNRHSPFGWELDYIVAHSLGGSSDPANLRVKNWRAGARPPQAELRLQTVAESEYARRGR